MARGLLIGRDLNSVEVVDPSATATSSSEHVTTVAEPDFSAVLKSDLRVLLDRI